MGDDTDMRVSRELGALTSEIANLGRQVTALFNKFDEHVEKDYELAGVVKLLSSKLDSNTVKIETTSKKVEEHEQIKQKAIGYGLGAGVGGAGLLSTILHFFNKGAGQ